MNLNIEGMLVLDDILTKVFLDELCIKVGQGLDNDLRELCRSYPQMKAFKEMKATIETNAFIRLLDPEIRQTLSLKALVKNYLNFNLVKTQQLSNWGTRPLTTNQIHYAACDALVLLRLFDSLSCEAEEVLQFNNKNNNCSETGSNDIAVDFIKSLQRNITSIRSPSKDVRSDSLRSCFSPDNSIKSSIAVLYNKGSNNWQSEHQHRWYSSLVRSRPKRDNLQEDEENHIPLPVGEGNHIYFDSVNDLSKLNDETIVSCEVKLAKRKKNF